MKAHRKTLPERTRQVLLHLACAFVAVFFVSVATADEVAKPNTTLWTTADTLMPGWGLYPNGGEYGGTKPLGKYSAWRSGHLTWVADFSAAGKYQVFVRRYAGTGSTSVSIDDSSPVAGGKGWLGDAPNATYRWEHLGQIELAKGAHHVDFQIEGMFDSILFTTDADFNPAQSTLPELVKNPTVRAPRTYRDDSHHRSAAANRGYVVGEITPDEELLNDYVPKSEQVLKQVSLWGAADQYINGSFAIRALQATGPLTATLKELVGPKSTRIEASEIDLRVVGLRRRSLNLWDAAITNVLLPDLLLRDDRTSTPPKGRQGGYGGGTCITAIPAHESRQIWLTVHVPKGFPAGIYKGAIQLEVGGDAKRNLSLPIELEVLPMDLKPVEGYYTIFNPQHPVDPKVRKLDGYYVAPERYMAELKDQVRHGVNAPLLYGGATTLQMAKDAGMTQAPTVMQWPGADTHADEYKAQAKALGFPDLNFYGVDEPEGERIEAARKEAEWRKQNGYHMVMAINKVAPAEALQDVVDFPIYSIPSFSGPDNANIKYARDKGFTPLSYWMGATNYAMWYRSLTGLYNTRCGYLGAAPWSYQDFPDDRVYNPHESYIQGVSYPDEYGQPISSLNWEAYRAGVDDVRYLQAMDRAIKAGEERLKQPQSPAGLAAALEKARAVRAARFESIGGKMLEYASDAKAATLDASRQEMARATGVLQAALAAPAK